MALDLVGVSFAQFLGGAGPHSLSIAGAQAGDRIIITGTTSTQNLTISASGFASITNSAGSDGSGRATHSIERVLDGTEGSSINVSKSENGAWIGFAIMRITEGHASQAAQCGVVHAAGGSDPNPPSVSPSWGTEQYLSIAMSIANIAANYPTGWPAGIPVNYTAVNRDWNGSTATIAVTKRVLTASGDDPGAFDHAQSGGFGITIAVRGGGVDVTPPSVPSNVSSPAKTASSVSLTYTASTDNVGVSGYKVRVLAADNTTIVMTVDVGATTGPTITGLQPDTQYNFRVAAYAAALNESAYSASIQVTTHPFAGAGVVDVDVTGTLNVQGPADIAGAATVGVQAAGNLNLATTRAFNVELLENGTPAVDASNLVLRWWPSIDAMDSGAAQHKVTGLSVGAGGLLQSSAPGSLFVGPTQGIAVITNVGVVPDDEAKYWMAAPDVV